MKLSLPPVGTLKPNDQHDPLPYYHRPVVGWFYRKRLRMGLDLLPNKGASRVLEVGVGSGILVPTLSSHFARYTGTDLVLANGLERLVAPSCQARFLQADLLQESSLPEASFDIVVCLSVLEHIPDAEAAASALARTLVKGGTLIAGYPMVNHLMTGLFRAIGFGNIEAHHVTAPAAIDKALRHVLRRGRRKALPAFAPVSLALYQCAAWIKD
ncbi:MAG TPA: class I SAM-dependent methyltransferase [Polyangia bacterium]